MTDYVFTGSTDRIMFGLVQAVNAWHTPASGDPTGLATGQTIVLCTGDHVQTDEPFEHAELVETDPPTAKEPDPDLPPTATAKPTKGTKK